ncbi:hypothetical protein PsYK624_173050 [Phanerochaete sordida]|uniref:Uncharacterized protein n=1 Tax=Phanerochaete sordida TaxID=48140 RepID=A0A9P3GZ41_9APHY|nr:hypothetical protein PsYK624_173050 [Phanerochaete sordida]
MPTLSLHQQLLHDVFEDAARLQALRRDELDLRFGLESSTEDVESESDVESNMSTTSGISAISFMSIDSAQVPEDSDAISNSGIDEIAADELYLRHMTALGERLHFLTTSRHLAVYKAVHKASQLHLVLQLYNENNPKRFRRNLRVFPPTFDALLNHIENHTIFQNQSNVPQMPVPHQLTIALYQFGHDENAAGPEAVAQWAGSSAGMVVKASRRVIVAFLALHDQVIRWPSAAEKKAAKEWAEADSCAAWMHGYAPIWHTGYALREACTSWRGILRPQVELFAQHAAHHPS